MNFGINGERRASVARRLPLARTRSPQSETRVAKNRTKRSGYVRRSIPRSRRICPSRSTRAGPTRGRRSGPLDIRDRIPRSTSECTEPVDELRDTGQRVHMGIGNVQSGAPCPAHAIRLREFHKVMDLVAVALPSVQSSAVKNGNTDIEQGGQNG